MMANHLLQRTAFGNRCAQTSACDQNRISHVKMLRWVAVPLSAIAVWYGFLVLGIVSVGVVDFFVLPSS
jgi:hypothetical protein